MDSKLSPEGVTQVPITWQVSGGVLSVMLHGTEFKFSVGGFQDKHITSVKLLYDGGGNKRLVIEWDGLSVPPQKVAPYLVEPTKFSLLEDVAYSKSPFQKEMDSYFLKTAAHLEQEDDVKNIPTQQDIATCNKCSLGGAAGVPGRWTGKLSQVVGHELMVVGEAPGAMEDAAGEPFVGQSGKLLRSWLKEAGFKGYFLSNAVKHRPPGNATPTPKQMKACLHWLEQEFLAVQPRVVLAVGKTACHALGMKGPMKKMHGFSFPYVTGSGKGVTFTVIGMYHPAYVLRQGMDEKLVNACMSVLYQAKEMVDKPTESKESPSEPAQGWSIPPSTSTLTKMLAVDVETDSLDPRTCQSVVWGWAMVGGWAGCSPKKSTYTKDVHLGTHPIILHHACFDLPIIMRKQGAEWNGTEVHDTMLMAKHAGYDDLSLKGLYSKIFKKPAQTFEQMAAGRDIKDIPDQEIGAYCRRDSEMTADLFDYIWDNHSLPSAYHNIDKPLIPILARMTLAGGFELDKERLKEYGWALTQEINHWTGTAHALAGHKFNVKSRDKVADVLHKELGLPVLSGLTKVKGRPIVDDAALAKLANLHVLPRVLRVINGKQKEVSAFVMPWLETEGSRLSSVYEFGADTGRLSCVTPDTKVLTDGLRWVKAGSLAVGAKLLAFEENPGRVKGSGRRWKVASVQKIDLEKRDVYRVYTAKGHVDCTADHKWLVLGSENGYEWRRTDHLNTRLDLGPTRVVYYMEPWSNPPAWRRWGTGWLAGFFDGEGCLQQRKHPHTDTYGLQVQACQVKNSVATTTLLSLLAKLGFKGSVRHRACKTPAGKKAQDQMQWTESKFHEVVRFLGMIRPQRLLSKLNLGLPREARSVAVVPVERVEYLGAKPIVVMETSTHTFLANGFAAHNCHGPNLQQVPEHLRKFLYAPEGYHLISLDYSQIEFRVAAHLSGDPEMRALYEHNADVHTSTALALGIPRKVAKTCNFALLYGGGPGTIVEQAGVTWQAAHAMHDQMRKTYPVYYAWAQHQANACRNGPLEGLYGRKHYIPDGPDDLMARQAANRPTQGSAVDICKMAMVRMDSWLSPMDVRFAAQIHDEIILAVPNDFSEEETTSFVSEARTRCLADNPLSIPIDVTVKLGANWGEMEEWIVP